MPARESPRRPLDVPAVGILVWNTCNARCAHCMPDSGPKDRTSLDDEAIFGVIRQAAENFGEDWIAAFSGGEPFLYPERLLAYVSLAADLGASTSVVTNGYWATSEKVARKLLEPFVEAGLGLVTLSVSSYHSAYVDPDRVSNAVLAARALGLDVGFKAVVSKSSTLRRVFGAVRRTEPWTGAYRIQEIKLLPGGRAANGLEQDIEAESELPLGPCPSSLLTVKPSGDVSPCCNGAGETERIALGNVRTESFAAIRENFETNELLSALREDGPASLLERLDPEVAETLRRKKYVSVCHLCIDVLNNLPKRPGEERPGRKTPGEERPGRKRSGGPPATLWRLRPGTLDEAAGGEALPAAE